MKISCLYIVCIQMIFAPYSYGMDLTNGNTTHPDLDMFLRCKALQHRLNRAQENIKNLQRKYHNFSGAQDKELLDLFLSIEVDEMHWVQAELQKLQAISRIRSLEEQVEDAPIPNQLCSFIMVGGLLLKSSHDPYICTLIEAFPKM